MQSSTMHIGMIRCTNAPMPRRHNTHCGALRQGCKGHRPSQHSPRVSATPLKAQAPTNRSMHAGFQVCRVTYLFACRGNNKSSCRLQVKQCVAMHPDHTATPTHQTLVSAAPTAPPLPQPRPTHTLLLPWPPSPVCTVGAYEDVGKGPQRTAGRQRLCGEHIERRAAQLPALQRCAGRAHGARARTQAEGRAHPLTFEPWVGM